MLFNRLAGMAHLFSSCCGARLMPTYFHPNRSRPVTVGQSNAKFHRMNKAAIAATHMREFPHFLPLRPSAGLLLNELAIIGTLHSLTFPPFECFSR